MITKDPESAGAQIGFTIIKDTDAEQIAFMVQEIETTISAQGEANVLVNMIGYKWQFPIAKHYDVSPNAKGKVNRIAIVGEEKDLKDMQSFSQAFGAKTTRLFKDTEIEQAWAWLKN